MAFNIVWEAFDARLAEQLQTFINTRLAAVKDRPQVLGEVLIQDLNFGSVPPEVQLIDITSPRAAFYAKHGDTPHPHDVQLVLRVSFSGDMSFNISTELTLNFPTPQFMSIPVMLGLRHLTLHGTCILAVINKRIYICFDDDEVAGGPQLDMLLESQVGDHERHVLRNVDRIERFIVEQLRRLMRAHLVYPDFVAVPLGDSSSSK